MTSTIISHQVVGEIDAISRDIPSHSSSMKIPIPSCYTYWLTGLPTMGYLVGGFNPSEKY